MRTASRGNGSLVCCVFVSVCVRVSVCPCVCVSVCLCVCVCHRRVRGQRVYGPFPCLVLQVMRCRAAVIYELSTGSGSSVDAEHTLLQILACGTILSCAREARAREHEDSAAAQDNTLLTNLRSPLLVVGLPLGWHHKNNTSVQEHTSRAWSFVYTAEGVRVNRSESLTIRDAFEFMRAGVLGGQAPN